MSTIDLARCRGSCLADVSHGRPLSAAVPVGGTVYAVSGELWVTQEGLYDDVVLAAGERFEVERRGLVVVSAVGRAAVAYIAPTTTVARSTVPYAVLARALRRRERKARRGGKNSARPAVGSRRAPAPRHHESREVAAAAPLRHGPLLNAVVTFVALG